jgi:hypothetical protein
MNHMGIATLLFTSFLALTSCGDNADKKADSKASLSPKMEFTNGVTEANKGAKKGPVDLKGTEKQTL